MHSIGSETERAPLQPAAERLGAWQAIEALQKHCEEDVNRLYGNSVQ